MNNFASSHGPTPGRSRLTPLLGVADAALRWPAGALQSASDLDVAPTASRSAMALAVTGVSAHGFTLVVGEEALRLPFNRFPWFRRARADRLSTVVWHSPDHLFWPRLNVELSLHFIRMLATVSADGR